jgi:hypothetical protein
MPCAINNRIYDIVKNKGLDIGGSILKYLDPSPFYSIRGCLTDGKQTYIDLLKE